MKLRQENKGLYKHKWIGIIKYLEITSVQQ